MPVQQPPHRHRRYSKLRRHRRADPATLDHPIDQVRTHMGERRLRQLEDQLADDTAILGVDERTPPPSWT